MAGTTSAASLTLACPATTYAVGGGGKAATNRTIDGSYPSNSTGVPAATGATPTYGTVTFSQAQADQTGYVVSAK